MNRPQRPKISAFIASSLDGYIARPDGKLDWLERIHLPHEDFGYYAFLKSVDTLIIGRKTYETASGAEEWPYKGKAVVVLSHTMNSVRDEASLFCGNLHFLVSKLFSEGSTHIWVDGGATLSQFLEAKMVDQLTLSVVPVLLGDGIPLFHKLKQELSCQLKGTRSFPNGLVQMQYEFANGL